MIFCLYIYLFYILCVQSQVIVKSMSLCFSLKAGRSDMTSFLDNHCGYDVVPFINV